MKKQPRTVYLHTIYNEPATFEGGMICYARRRTPAITRYSMAEIIADRKASDKFRRGQGWNTMKYGVQIIAV